VEKDQHNHHHHHHYHHHHHHHYFSVCWSKEGTVKHRQSKEASMYGHTMRKQGSCLEKEIMQGTVPGARRRGRPRTAWMDNIKT